MSSFNVAQSRTIGSELSQTPIVTELLQAGVEVARGESVLIK